jgi:hypothetical protein
VKGTDRTSFFDSLTADNKIKAIAGDPASNNQIDKSGLRKWAKDMGMISIHAWGAETGPGSNNELTIETAIQYCAKNNKILYIPKADDIYYVGGAINITDQDSVHIRIDGHVALANSVNTPLMNISGSSNVLIEGSGILDGRNEGQSVNNVLILVQTNNKNIGNIHFKGVTIQNSEDQTIKFLPSTANDTIRYVSVKECKIFNSEAEAIVFDADLGHIEFADIHKNIARNVNDFIFTDEGGSVDHLQITNNDAEFFGTEGIGYFGATRGLRITNNSIAAVDNIVNGCLGISVGKKGNKRAVIISNNTIDFRSFIGSGAPGDALEWSVHSDSSMGILIVNNTAWNAGTLFEFSSEDQGDAYFGNMILAGNSGFNLRDGFKWIDATTFKLDVENVIISHNILQGSTILAGTGIQVRQSANSYTRKVLITTNIVNGFFEGIKLNDGTYISVIGNIVTDCGTNGAMRWGGSTDSGYFAHNILTNNSGPNIQVTAPAQPAGLNYNFTLELFEIYKNGGYWGAFQQQDSTITVGDSIKIYVGNGYLGGQKLGN